MSIFKKIFSKEELSPEEQAKRELEKAEKQKQKEIKREENRRIADEYRAQRQREKEAEQAEELKKMERFIGPDPGFTKKTFYTAYAQTFNYLNGLLSNNENVLSVIKAEYDKTKKREIKGLLVATDRRLIFAFIKGHNQYIEEFSYAKVNGISLANDGWTAKELHIDYGKERKKFDDIIDDKEFKLFITAVQKQIGEHKSGKTAASTSTNNSSDKYKQLEQLARLKDQGILSEEEFQNEKQKILTS